MATSSRLAKLYTGALRGNLARATTGMQQMLAVQNLTPTVYNLTPSQIATLQAALIITNALLTATQQLQWNTGPTPPTPPQAPSSSSTAFISSGSGASGS